MSRVRRAIICAAALANAAAPEAAAARGSVAWDTVESLTTEVGPRMAGTPAEARARTWAVAWLTRLGFKNVHEEDAEMPLWVRGTERAEIVSPFPQPLTVTALGRSGATPPEGLTGEIAYFKTLDLLRAAPDAQVRGKIVFVTHAMQRAQDESQYVAFGNVRRAAPAIAASKGAAAILIRSLGTDYHRNPHTGLTNWGDVTPIPAGALSLPDSENLERVLSRGRPVSVKLVLTSTTAGTGTTGNVIAEIPGSEQPQEIVLVGAHLDSWDLGTGAVDDGAGVAIVTAAAKRILDQKVRPRRTIRIVLFGAEEIGLHGSNSYARAHGTDRHVVAIEMDHGSGAVRQLASNVSADGRTAIEQIAQGLGEEGVILGPNDVKLGSDLDALREIGVPTLSLRQDGTSYFDIHHTPDDTLDKVDPVALEQAARVLSHILLAVANGVQNFGSSR